MVRTHHRQHELGEFYEEPGFERRHSLSSFFICAWRQSSLTPTLDPCAEALYVWVSTAGQK